MKSFALYNVIRNNAVALNIRARSAYWLLFPDERMLVRLRCRSPVLGAEGPADDYSLEANLGSMIELISFSMDGGRIYDRWA